MSDLTLFDLDAPEWVIIGTWGVCGLCGTKCAYNQGGTRTGAVCDDCAQIDLCTIRDHEAVIERRSIPAHRIEQVAHCEHCGWFLALEHWADEGAWVLYTPEEILDACAEHNRPRHTSHWGMSHEIGEHDALIAKQARRRAKYLARRGATA